MTDDPSSFDTAATLYRFCATSMQYPDKGWLTDEYFKSLYSLLEILQATSEIDAIKEALSSSADPLEDLQIEHTRLFINGYPHVAAPPYGSVYMDKSLQGQHAEKTAAFYLDHGYVLQSDSDLPDHIVHQLEFLSLLAVQKNAEAEAEFLRTIFNPWYPTFFLRVKQESHHPFYSVIVQLIHYLTKEENEDGIQFNEA